MTRLRLPGASSRWLLAWLACTVATLALFARPRGANIDIDEIYWVGSSYYYDLAFNQLDWTHPDWRMLTARENPPVARYAIGLSLALRGQRVVNRDMVSCFRLMFPARPTTAQHIPHIELFNADIGSVTLADCTRPMGGPGVTRKRDILYLSRQAMIVCAALGSLALFLLGASIADRATGLLASQLLLLHPLVRYAYNQAMADAVAMMFTIAGVYFTWRLYERVTREDTASPGGTAGLTAAAGIMLGLACATKMNALVGVMLFGAAFAVAAALAWKRGQPRRTAGILGVGVAGGVVAFLTFVLVNPAILADFPGAITALFTLQGRGLEHTMNVMPELRLTSLAQKFAAVAHTASGIEEPRYPVAKFLLVSALAVLAAARWPRPGAWFAVAWFALSTIVVTVWIPIAWPRYLIPVIPPFVLVVSCAAVAVIRHIIAIRSAPAS